MRLSQKTHSFRKFERTYAIFSSPQKIPVTFSSDVRTHTTHYTPHRHMLTRVSFLNRTFYVVSKLKLISLAHKLLSQIAKRLCNHKYRPTNWCDHPVLTRVDVTCHVALSRTWLVRSFLLFSRPSWSSHRGGDHDWPNLNLVMSLRKHVKTVQFDFGARRKNLLCCDNFQLRISIG